MVLVTFSLKIGGAALGFLLNVVMARALGSHGFGVYLIAFTAASIVAVFATAGMTFSAVRFVPQYVVHKDWPAIRGFFRTGNMLTLIGALTAVGASVLAIAVFRGDFEPELLGALLLGAVSIPLITALQTLVAYLQALGKILASEAVSNIVRPVFTIVAVGVLYSLFERPLEPSEGLVVTLASFAIATGLSWRIFMRVRPKQVLQAEPVYHHAVWLGAGFSMLLILSSAVLNERLDIVMVGALLGAEPAGVYGAASRAALAIGLALSAVNVFLMRQLSATFAEHNMEKLKALAVFGAWIAFFISVLAGLVLVALSDFVLGLFGENFAVGSDALMLLVLAQCLTAAFGATGGLAVVAGGQRFVVAAMFVGLLSNVVLNYVLVPVYGIAGAGLATLAATVISQVLIAAWCRVRLGFNPSVFGGLPWNSFKGIADEAR